MKKITLLLALLISSIGFSQEVVQNFTSYTIGANDTFGNLTSSSIETDPATGAANGSVLKLVSNAAGNGWQGSNISLKKNVLLTTTKTMSIDVYSATEASILLKVNGGVNGALEAAAEATHTGGSAWQTLSFTFNTSLDNKAAEANGEYTSFVVHTNWVASTNSFEGDGAVTARTIYVDNISGPVPASGSVATLSDLKVNGTTINGFSSATENYVYDVPAGGAVPTVTATASDDGNATVTITPAGAIPGDTTVKVVSQNTNVTKNYKVSFKYETAPTDAPAAPPARNAADVISLYGDSYGTAIGFNGVPWDGGSDAVEGSYAGNNALKITNGSNDFIGFDIANAAGFVDATAMTHVHADFWIDGDYVAGQVLKVKLSNHTGGTGETNAIIKEVFPVDGDTRKWYSLDAELGAGNARERIAQVLLIYTNSATPPGVVFADNIYMYRAATASVDKNNLLNVSLSPSPAKNDLKISAKNTIENVTIYNVLGKKVKSVAINKNEDTIDVSTLNTGIYILKYTVNSKVGTMKFVKE